MRDRLLALMKDVWKDGRVFDAWRDALIIPVPKKGNLQSCDNWRGIRHLACCGESFCKSYPELSAGDCRGVVP